MNNDGTSTHAALAMATLNRAAQLRPRDARVYYQMAEVLPVRKAAMRTRCRTTPRPIALDPDYPEPVYKLGQAYVRLGRHEDAQRMFDRHREVMSKQEAGLDRRSSEIQSFIVSMRGLDEPRSMPPEATRHN
jgi:Flp pilus assembly protein TadD